MFPEADLYGRPGWWDKHMMAAEAMDEECPFSADARSVPEGMVQPVGWADVPPVMKQSIMAVARRNGVSGEPHFVGAISGNGASAFGGTLWYGVITGWEKPEAA